MEDFPAAFNRAVGRPVRQDVFLREHSSFCIGGAAAFFFEARTRAELRAAVLVSRRQAVPFYLIGSATNILFDDEGFRGLILKNACEGTSLGEASRIDALSGTRLAGVVEFAAGRGLSGMEFLAGIPGTLGGAVFGNAGAFGRAIGDILVSAELLDARGEEISVGPDFFRFSYRRSRLRDEHLVLLRASLALSPGSEAAIRAKMDDYIAQRRAKHPPWETACAGCYFKNPVLPDGSRVSAGKILEEAGAKTLRSGGAAVSARHANFIVNEGGAKAEDVLKLAAALKKCVRERSGYELEEEVVYLPADASMP